MSIYSSIGFDMDSTLVEANWFTLIYDSVNATKLDFSESDYRRAWQIADSEWRKWSQPLLWEPSYCFDRSLGYKWAGRMAELLGGGKQKQAEAVDIMYKKFIQPKYFSIYEEVFTILDEIKFKGFKVAIISNWNWRLQELCDALGISKYMNAIVSSAKVGALKPHPKIFQTAADILNVPIRNIIYVGDSEDSDVIGSLNAGATPILLDRKGIIESSSAIYKIKNLSELPKLLSLIATEKPFGRL